LLLWTKAKARGFLGARLLRGAEDQRHYISFAEWETHVARQTWRSQPECAGKFGSVRLFST